MMGGDPEDIAVAEEEVDDPQEERRAAAERLPASMALDRLGGYDHTCSPCRDTELANTKAGAAGVGQDVSNTGNR